MTESNKLSETPRFEDAIESATAAFHDEEETIEADEEHHKSLLPRHGTRTSRNALLNRRKWRDD